MVYEKLFSPITINKMELQNRIVLAPIVSWNMVDEDGFVTPEYSDYVCRRARGGISMAIIGAVSAQDLHKVAIASIHSDLHIPKLKEMVNRIHSESDCKILPQIFIFPLQAVEDMTTDSIKQAVEDFVNAAIRSKEAGFDGIEIHGAHGYLLANFLSATNRRKDEYGKNIKGRMKLTVEIYKKCREALGKDYPIGIRINGDDFTIGGNTLLHTMEIAEDLAELGLDYISLSAGGRTEDSQAIIPGLGAKYAYPPVGGYSGYRAVPPNWTPEMVNVYLAERIKGTLRKAGYSTPVMTAGRIPYAQLAEDILQEGKADLIGLARPILRDPNWALKVKEGREKDIDECEYCNGCMDSLWKGEGHYCIYLHE